MGVWGRKGETSLSSVLEVLVKAGLLVMQETPTYILSCTYTITHCGNEIVFKY